LVANATADTLTGGMARVLRFATFALALFAAPLAAEAQQAGKVLPRIGFLGNSDPKSTTEPPEAFRQGLRDLGWIEGQTITIEYRWADGQTERVPELATALVRAKCDVIIVSGSVAVQAARQATSHIPIVIAAILIDPASAGFVASLAHPGGNITGLASQYEEVVTKQVQLLTEAVPGLTRLVLLNLSSAVGTDLAAAGRRRVRATAANAAATLGLKARLIEVTGVADFEGAFLAARDGRAQAIHVLPSPFFNAHRRLLIDLAARYRLPAMYEFREYVHDGGLMSYGVSLPDMYRRAASYVDRILKGAKPGDLPIEQPSKFDLVINLKTAKALGLTIPPSLLLRADDVIQ
jgi:putative tryptophan/tyrosine transport system substrate-binding protein